MNFESENIEDKLTFRSAKQTFEKYGIEFSGDKYKALGIKDGDYTNLGLLLSDQCKHSIKIAVFNDETCTEFRDSKEFEGSVFEQFDEAIRYLDLCNKTRSVIKGVTRTDILDYPKEAIREALLNAIVHRDYAFSGSIIINVNDKKMEFISLGGLMPGLSTDDIRIGISQPRNKKLAEVFHRLKLIESYGTGIRRIYKLYEKYDIEPVIEVSTNAFKIILPNINEVDTTQKEKEEKITYQMREVIDYIIKNEKATDEELGKLLNVKTTRLYIITKKMCEMGLIHTKGRGKTKEFVIEDKGIRIE